MTWTLVEYQDEAGRSAFGRWYQELSPQAAAKVTTALYRLEQGNTSNCKSVGGGVSEVRIDFGPGYRVYYGYDGKVMIILLGGGSKKRQQHDIEQAKQRWLDYKHSKRIKR